MFNYILKRIIGLASRSCQLRRAAPPVNISLYGPSSYDVVVTGTSQYQDALEKILARNNCTAARHPCVVSLVQSQERKFSKKMFGVAIDDEIIGYCPAFLATQLRMWVSQWCYEGARLQCAAIVTRTLDSSRDAMRFAVNLDIDLPFKMSANPLMGRQDCWCVSA